MYSATSTLIGWQQLATVPYAATSYTFFDIVTSQFGEKTTVYKYGRTPIVGVKAGSTRERKANIFVRKGSVGTGVEKYCFAGKY